MADEQEQRAAFVMLLRSHSIRDLRVLNAFESMPRPYFVAPEFAAAAGRDSPLPLPCGQTMEKPSYAARVIEAMKIEPVHQVLEIGAGSGWLTSVISRLAMQVTSFERYAELAEEARRRLEALGVTNVDLKTDDGAAITDTTKYDRIFIAASVKTIPEKIAARLKNGGLLFAAIGEAEGEQQLTRFSKTKEGLNGQTLFPARLAPLEAA